MEKRKLRILTVVVFAGVLIFGALRQNSTGRGELGEIQVAMWNLGKWTICSFPMNIAGSRTEAPEERRCMPGRIC